jgi:hypothetical protein
VSLITSFNNFLAGPEGLERKNFKIKTRGLGPMYSYWIRTLLNLGSYDDFAFLRFIARSNSLVIFASQCMRAVTITVCYTSVVGHHQELAPLLLVVPDGGAEGIAPICCINPIVSASTEPSATLPSTRVIKSIALKDTSFPVGGMP